MELEAGLQQFVLADPTVSSLATGGISPILLPDTPLLPAATYQRISTVTLNTMTSNVALTQVRMQFDTWAKSYADARSLASAIISVLEGYSGTLPNGVYIANVALDSQIDLYESTARLYRNSVDFLIWFSRQ